MTVATVSPAEVAEGVKALEILAKLKTGKLAFSIAYNLKQLRNAQTTLTELSENILKDHSWQYRGKYIYSCQPNEGETFDPAKFVGDGEPEEDDYRDMEEGDVFSHEGMYYRYLRGGSSDSLHLTEIGRVNMQSVCMRDVQGYRDAMQKLNTGPVEVAVMTVDPIDLADVDDITAECYWIPMINGFAVEREA